MSAHSQISKLNCGPDYCFILKRLKENSEKIIFEKKQGKQFGCLYHISSHIVVLEKLL